MKIGILTQMLWGNYGCILQNYALQIILKRLGHKPYTIHYYFSIRQVCEGLVLWMKYFINRIFCIYKKHSIPRSMLSYIYSRNSGVIPFCRKYINETLPMRGCKLKTRVPSRFDAFVVGSDQIWRPAYNGGEQLYYMYLDFVQENNSFIKIAYAASFGVDNWEYNEEQTKKCRLLAHKFDAISVREASGSDLCRNYLAINAQHLLDPTLLLSADDYRTLIKDEDFGHQGELCVYILDMTQEKQRMVTEFCQKNNLRWYRIGDKLENGDLPCVESWLAGFDKAKYVITDSFHGSVFSIIFNKPFVSIGNDARGMSRFSSLLGMFNLEDRLVSENDELTAITPPNWEAVNAILSEWQKKSINFLKTNLS